MEKRGAVRSGYQKTSHEEFLLTHHQQSLTDPSWQSRACHDGDVSGGQGSDIWDPRWVATALQEGIEHPGPTNHCGPAKLS